LGKHVIQVGEGGAVRRGKRKGCPDTGVGVRLYKGVLGMHTQGYRIGGNPPDCLAQQLRQQQKEKLDNQCDQSV
jgi:hypothetical protein